MNSIKEFYQDQEIFLTGASGFVGLFVIEKLLRSCSGLKKIFVLMRSKRNVSAEDRLRDLKNNSVFNRIKNQCPEVLEKLELIEGDCSEVGLNINPEILWKLENVSIIIHSAASIRFNDRLKKILMLNVRGTREVCQLAQTLKNLKVLLYVSTTYNNSQSLVIEEKVYPINQDWKQYLKFADNFDDATLSSLENKYDVLIYYRDLPNCDHYHSDHDRLIHPFPNTYVLSKNLAEHVCKDYSCKLPIVIYRASIVSNAETEPEPGIMGSVNDVLAFMFSYISGVTRTLLCGKNSGLNLIPVDLCAKGLIVAAWKKTCSSEDNGYSLPVYNSSTRFLTFEDLKSFGEYIVEIAPLKNMVWKPNILLTDNQFLATINLITTQVLPGMILDVVLKLQNKKPMILKIIRKLVLAHEATKSFVLKIHKVSNKNFMRLNDLIPDDEKEDFFLDKRIKEDKDYGILMCERALSDWFKQTEKETLDAKQRYRLIKLTDFLLKISVLLGLFYFLNDQLFYLNF